MICYEIQFRYQLLPVFRLREKEEVKERRSQLYFFSRMSRIHTESLSVKIREICERFSLHLDETLLIHLYEGPFL